MTPLILMCGRHIWMTHKVAEVPEEELVPQLPEVPSEVPEVPEVPEAKKEKAKKPGKVALEAS